MNRKLNLVKEKLPKLRRRKTNDEDNLFLKGMYNDYLQTEGYDVETVGINTANKETQTNEYYDDPEIDYQRFPWMFNKIEAEAKDFQTLLDNRRDKAVQTFRYMLRQNYYSPPSSSDPPKKPLSTSSRETPPMSSKSSSNETIREAEASRGIRDDIRRVREFFSSGNDVEVGSNRSDDASASSGRSRDDSKVSLASGKKNNTPPPSSSSSVASSSVRSGVVLPVESGSSQPEIIQSSRSSQRTVQHISSGSSHPSQRTIQHISSGSSNKSHHSISS